MKKSESTITDDWSAIEILDDAFKWRYATKKFNRDLRIEKKDFDALLISLRMSPSAFGLQPFHFFVIRNKVLREELFKHAYNQMQVIDASEFIVFTAKTKFEDDELKSFVDLTARLRNYDQMHSAQKFEKLRAFADGFSGHDLHHWSARQAYLAMGELLSAAAMLRIDACPMEGIDVKNYDRILGLEPLNLRTVAAVALGYRSKDDEYQRQAKVRQDRDKLISII